MRSISLIVLAALAATAGTTSSHATEALSMKKATSIIAVEEIEPCLPFWTDALGFEITATVPHGDAIGFAMLNKDGVELMYQSRASIADDLEASGAPAGLAEEMAGSTATLFIEVDDLDAVVGALGDRAQVIVPRRTTFYGMDEIFVRAPCGTVVGFAARAEAQ